MGSSPRPTTTASSAEVQPNRVAFEDLPAPADHSNEAFSLVIPLAEVDEERWRALTSASPLIVVPLDPQRIEVRMRDYYLGVVPLQFVETVLERQLFVAIVEITGSRPPDLRVRLSPARSG